MHLIVRNQQIYGGESIFPCAIGRGGISAAKQEGDGATPLGTYPLRSLWYRPDRLQCPATGLLTRTITPFDGWCDDPEDPFYNRAVQRPYGGSHEEMWRADSLYDLVIVVGYNDAPIIPGKGSAIFIHISRQGYSPTAGCVALQREHLLTLLPYLSGASTLTIEPDSH